MTKEDTPFLRKMKRREFLALGAMVTLPVLLDACGGTPSSASETPTVGNTTPSSSTATPAPSPTRPPTPTEADWQALANNLQGTLVRPSSVQYPTAYQLFDPRFDTIHPQALAFCASPKDVQTCLTFVRKFNLPFTARSGGHSYAGYSTTTGLVLDVTRMNAVSVNTGNGNATIGAGARLIDVYAALAQYGLALPAGSCPTVGIAGLTLGGGVGVLSRKFGLTCDNLLSAQVVIADGSVLTCDANNYADLFWALRGGGGGNFGLVTSFTFQTHPIASLSLFTLDWAWSEAANLVNAWQNWAPQAPDELWSNCLLISSNDATSTPPIARANGVYVGDVASLNSLLQQLINRVGSAPTSSYVSSAGLLDTMMGEAGCYGKSVAECHLPSQNPQGQLQRDTYGARSDYITSALPTQGIDILVNEITRRQSSPTLGKGGILLDASGGAIHRVAANATAFVHRSDLFLIQYIANFNAGDPNSVTANEGWLANTWQAMRPYASGAAYQNYIDPDLPNWQSAYYGANLPQLQRVKTTYDPGNLFHFKQGILPSGD